MSSTSVYAVSVDSRSRNPDQPDNAYSIQLQRTLDRVKSVQLGSFQFQDARSAFTSTSTFKYSEPVEIPPGTSLTLIETCRVFDKVANTQTETRRTIGMTIPPTLNQIIGMDNATQELQTANDHGLQFGVRFYPEVGLRMQLVGGDFPQDLHTFVTPSFPTDSPSPVITDATVNTPYFTRNCRTFTWTSGYLSELTGGVGSAELRMLDTTGTPDNYHSYIHAPRPTLVELMVMLNAATTYMSTRTDLSGTVVSASFTTPIIITTSTPHLLSSGDEIVISGVTGNDGANGTFIINTYLTDTTLVLTNSVGTGVGAGGAWFSPQQLTVPVRFGFDNNVNKLAAVGTTRVTNESNTSRTTCSVQFVGTLAALLGFGDVQLDPITHATLPSNILRTVQLKQGTFDRDQLDEDLTQRLNPLDFRVLEADRTLNYVLPGGTPTSLVIMYGRYSPDQLVDLLNFTLNSIPANITVSYSGATGRFTFTHNLGLDFTLDFSATTHMANKLGFDAIKYADAVVHTSVRRAVHGIADGVAPPTNSYSAISRRTRRGFTFLNANPTQFYTVSGTTAVQTGGSWTPLTGTNLDFAHHLQPGDILTAQRPTISGPTGSTRAITAQSATTPIVITTGAAHGLTTGDHITIVGAANSSVNGNHFVTVTGATTFELDGTSTLSVGPVTNAQWWTNVSFVTGSQKPHASYNVVVKSVWDASTGAPLLTLEPTASMLSVEDAGTLSRQTLGTPSLTDGLILLLDARRNVFMMHFEHPEGGPETFGFPPVAWPPSNEAILAGGSGIDITKELIYVPSSQSLPVSNIYDSPFSYNLKPSDYILVVLRDTCSSQDRHTHSYRGDQFPILAKLLISNPFTHISEQMHFTTFAGTAKFNSLDIEFQNPDGSPVEFNGRPHNYTLLFTLFEDQAVLPCV